MPTITFPDSIKFVVYPKRKDLRAEYSIPIAELAVENSEALGDFIASLASYGAATKCQRVNAGDSSDTQSPFDLAAALCEMHLTLKRGASGSGVTLIGEIRSVIVTSLRKAGKTAEEANAVAKEIKTPEDVTAKFNKASAKRVLDAAQASFDAKMESADFELEFS